MSRNVRNRLLQLVLVFFVGMLVMAGAIWLRYEEAEEEAPQNTGVSLAISAEGFEAGVTPVVEQGDWVGIKFVTEGSYPGYEYVIGTNVLGEDYPQIYKIDEDGWITQHWVLKNKYGGILGDRRILPNGNILFVVGLDGVFEMNSQGQIVWEYFDSTVNHHAELMPNGHLLMANIGCDCVRELDRETKQVVWEWSASQNFGRYDDPENYIGTLDFPGARNLYESADVSSVIFPHDWTHINYVQYLPETDTFMVSLRTFDLIAEINRDGDILWTFGPGVIKHQHYPRVLPDNTVLVYDNGNGRVIRVTRDHEIIWEYNGLHVPFLGDNDLLPDGNYKIVQTTAFETTGKKSDLRVVNPDGEILWRMFFPDVHMYRVDMRKVPDGETVFAAN